MAELVQIQMDTAVGPWQRQVSEVIALDLPEVNDRRVTVRMDCGHSFNLGIAIDAPIPYVTGDERNCWSCQIRSVPGAA